MIRGAVLDCAALAWARAPIADRAMAWAEEPR